MVRPIGVAVSIGSVTERIATLCCFGELAHRRDGEHDLARQAVELPDQEDAEFTAGGQTDQLAEAFTLGRSCCAGDAGIRDQRDELVALALGEGANRLLLHLEAVAVGGLLVGRDADVAGRLAGDRGVLL
jgi:hypothetical protein